ncbi:hypothetical protein ACO0LB_07915 [Undibacterium sp. SXout7W]|uniref:hypothetical protein n=1 Tax=Undibacterium sp. SXout7W TaxID=3413049 RepID=UPI003BEFFF2A
MNLPQNMAHLVSAAATVLFVVSGAVQAKLPEPGPEAKAKAEEAKAKTAWSDKVAAFQLCKAQDRVAAHYQKEKSIKPAAVTTPACADPGPYVAPDVAASPAQSPAPTPTPTPTTGTSASAAVASKK